ncbi:zinc-dependent peptidase [Flagellimonas myxillae]|uniref:zinc-dependent peptidase n=1 Tax=Flagellimonas myxillae TaxID=2942214 RepID=UPI00201E7755|nr:zinc-dependent peptidase [Muricauda myxillae]MCL6265000.1 zinc-dependent peptidase [Muricauda myxillae]
MDGLGLTATQKEIAALVLAFGLLYVFARVGYQQILGERFTVYNVFHPVRRITARQRNFINSFLLPYEKFDDKQRKTFLRRFAWFKSKKPFIFYGNIENKEEIRAYVSASAVLLTMGMGDFRFERSISRIVIYPNEFYSRIGKNHHVGEYNPRLRTLVFSAEALAKGFKIPNDNMNLGIHEVAHALMFETKKKSSWEARRFKVGLVKIKSLYDMPDFQDRLSESDYFREYSRTNFYEFFAVAAENFVETPEKFKEEFVGIYNLLAKMFNMEFS